MDAWQSYHQSNKTKQSILLEFHYMHTICYSEEVASSRIPRYTYGICSRCFEEGVAQSPACPIGRAPD